MNVFSYFIREKKPNPVPKQVDESIPHFMKPIDAELQRRKVESGEMGQTVEGIVQMLFIGCTGTAIVLAETAQLSQGAINHLRYLQGEQYQGRDYRIPKKQHTL